QNPERLSFQVANGEFFDGNDIAWNLLAGRSNDGTNNRLRPLPATPWYIDRWQEFYPDSEMYQADSESMNNRSTSNAVVHGMLTPRHRN
ncbi:MAG: hypothetical protein AAGG44_10030, partial [Planctomycetota bacterium]